LHRFDTPDPQPCGVWRYQAVSAVKTQARDKVDGDNMTKADGEPTNPECGQDKIWQCSAEDWRPCDRCNKLVCEKHDYLIPVWPPEDGAREPANMICMECIAELWYRGDISQGSRMQYIN